MTKMVNAIENRPTPYPKPVFISAKMKIKLKNESAMICPAMMFAKSRIISENGFVIIQGEVIRPERECTEDLLIGFKAHIEQPIDWQQNKDQIQHHDQGGT